MKKMSKLFAAAMMAMAAFGSAQAMDLTVFEGTETSRLDPINIYYYDTSNNHSQVIFPESALTEMIGCEINSLKFYLDRNISVTKDGLLQISLGVTEQDRYSSSAYVTEGLTVVTNYTIPNGVSELEITFDQPYMYNGGNLVFDCNLMATGNEITGYFYGVNPYYNSAISRDNLHQFLPKTTFDYTPQEYKAVVMPKEVNFGSVSKGNVVNQEVTLKNTGRNAITPAFGTIADPFSINAQPVELASGESMTFSVAFDAATAGTYAENFTIDCGAAGTITVPVTASCVTEVLVADGTDKNAYVPLIILNYNETGLNYTQMIYPASMLTALNGKKINSLTYYTDAPMTKISGGKIQLSLKEVDFTEFVDDQVNEMTVVAEVTPTFNGNEMLLTFDTPFEYNGGNLAVEVNVTEPGEYNYSGTGSYFMGQRMDEYVSFYWDAYWGTGTQSDFLPKATFGYVDEVEPQPEYELGDVNHDQKVNIVDVTELIDALLNGSEIPAEGNVNGDQTINIVDVTELIDMLLGGN